MDRNLKGKRIALIGENRYEWVISYLAVTCGGMIIAPLDKALPDKEIASLIKRSEVDAVIYEKKHEDLFKKLKNDKSINLNLLICMDIEDDNKEVISFQKLLDKGKKLIKEKNKEYDKIKIDSNAMSIMLFTSGTTSTAKIVMLSQNNILSNLYAYQTHFKINQNDILLSFLPIHHTFECSITILYGFYSGATVAFCDGLRYIQSNLKEYGVSIFVAVPLVLETMYKKITKAIADQGKTKLINTMTKISNALLKVHIDIRKLLFKQIIDNFGGKLRMVLYGAASLDKDTIIGLNNFGINSIQGYGLTETSPVLTAEAENKHKPGSIGYPLDNVEIKIDNPDEDGVGEILAKGPNIMLGYYNDEKKTKEAFKDGWFKTGDFGYIDNEGFIFITGRKNDIIVLRNGKNVYPQELEFLISKLPYVSECMVFARNESNTDTAIVAKIVYNKDVMEHDYPDTKKEDYEKIIWKDVKEINKNLPTYKHIKKVIVTDEPMIKTTTQKVKRNEEIKKTEKELQKNEITESTSIKDDVKSDSKEETSLIKVDNKKTKIKGSYITGIIGALIGGLIGAIPWILVYIYGNLMIAVLAILIAGGEYFGYKLFRGKITKKLPIIITLLSIVIVSATSLVIIPALLLHTNGLDVNANMLQILYQDSEFNTAIFKDTIIAVIFAILGTSVINANIKKSLNSNNINTKKENIEDAKKEAIDKIKPIFIKYNATSKSHTIEKLEISAELSENNINKELFKLLKTLKIVQKEKGRYYYIEENEDKEIDEKIKNKKKISKESLIAIIVAIISVISIIVVIVTGQIQKNKTTEVSDGVVSFEINSSWNEFYNYFSSGWNYYKYISNLLAAETNTIEEGGDDYSQVPAMLNVSYYKIDTENYDSIEDINNEMVEYINSLEDIEELNQEFFTTKNGYDAIKYSLNRTADYEEYEYVYYILNGDMMASIDIYTFQVEDKKEIENVGDNIANSFKWIETAE